MTPSSTAFVSCCASPAGHAPSPAGALGDDAVPVKERIFAADGEGAYSPGQQSGLLSPTNEDELMRYSYRWCVLVGVFLLNLVNAGLWLTYSPISDLVSQQYGVAESVVNILSLCLSAVYGPVCWTAAPLVRKIGFAHSVRVAALLTALGAVVRALGRTPSTFMLLVAGQVLSGVARPVISQLLGLVSLNWFPQEQRQMSTAVAALGNPFGVAIGFLLSPMLTHKDPARVPFLNEVTAAGSLAICFLVCIIVRERPATDPSIAARDARKGRGLTPFSDELKALRNSQYWLLAVSFGFAFGQCNATAVLLNQMFKPFGYDHQAVGITGMMTIAPGVVGAMLVSAFLGRKMKHARQARLRQEEPSYRFLYREVLILIYIVGGSMMTCMVWLAMRQDLPQFNVWLLGSAGLFGFFVQPCFSVALECATECIYPASPSTAAAGVIMMAQYVGLVVSAFCGWYIDQEPDEIKRRRRCHIAGMAMSTCWVVAGLAMLGYKGKPNLRRLTHEQNEEVAQYESSRRQQKEGVPACPAALRRAGAGAPEP